MGDFIMDKKLQEIFAWVWVSELAQECEDCSNSPNSCNDGTIKMKTLYEVFANKPALIDKPLTFRGYMETVFALFKVAFLTKVPKGFRRTIRCAVCDESVRHKATLIKDDNAENLV